MSFRTKQPQPLWETGAVRSMPSTYQAFGNNGSVPLDQGVDAPANTALPDLPNRLAVLHDLARVCSDHLPVVQQYRITAPAVAFLLIVPSTAISGMPFDVTVVAVDAFGNVDTNYQGTVTFSTSDPDSGVMLPANYTFTAGDGGDNGMHTFSSGITLATVGDQTVTITDTISGITSSVTITVTP